GPPGPIGARGAGPGWAGLAGARRRRDPPVAVALAAGLGSRCRSSLGTTVIRLRAPLRQRRSTSQSMAQILSIRVLVPAMLRPHCDGASELVVPAPSVRAALEHLEGRHPTLHRNICDETGAVRRHINVFVNSSNMRDLAGLDTALSPGDVVTILPAVSGG